MRCRAARRRSRSSRDDSRRSRVWVGQPGRDVVACRPRWVSGANCAVDPRHSRRLDGMVATSWHAVRAGSGGSQPSRVPGRSVPERSTDENAPVGSTLSRRSKALAKVGWSPDRDVVASMPSELVGGWKRSLPNVQRTRTLQLDRRRAGDPRHSRRLDGRLVATSWAHRASARVLDSDPDGEGATIVKVWWTKHDPSESKAGRGRCRTSSAAVRSLVHRSSLGRCGGPVAHTIKRVG